MIPGASIISYIHPPRNLSQYTHLRPRSLVSYHPLVFLALSCASWNTAARPIFLRQAKNPRHVGTGRGTYILARSRPCLRGRPLHLRRLERSPRRIVGRRSVGPGRRLQGDGRGRSYGTEGQGDEDYDMTACAGRTLVRTSEISCAGTSFNLCAAHTSSGT